MNTKLIPQPEDDPEILDEVPDRDSKTLTDYDKRNLKTYIKLLDADQAGRTWCDAARTILNRDPDNEPEKAMRTYRQHMDRALWLTREGWRELASDPEGMLRGFKGQRRER